MRQTSRVNGLLVMKKTHLIGLLFVVIATGVIVSLVFQLDTYAGFAEARAHPGRQFHIIGKLDTEMPVVERVEQGALMLSFYMVDGQGDVAEVLYFGQKPQDFELSDEVVLIGKYESGRFMASSLLLKCPSKYRPEELGSSDYLLD